MDGKSAKCEAYSKRNGIREGETRVRHAVACSQDARVELVGWPGGRGWDGMGFTGLGTGRV